MIKILFPLTSVYCLKHSNSEIRQHDLFKILVINRQIAPLSNAKQKKQKPNHNEYIQSQWTHLESKVKKKSSHTFNDVCRSWIIKRLKITYIVMSFIRELTLVWRWDVILCAHLLVAISFKDSDGLNKMGRILVLEKNKNYL